MVLFDGHCNLCNGLVRFIIGRDPDHRFQFAALQSPASSRLLGTPANQIGWEPDTVVLLEDGRTFTRSAAALRILGGLKSPWPLAGVFRAVPRPIRDWAYDQVARRRFRLFGRRDECMVPTPELRARFLDD